jgi:hypothetical protein
MISPTRIALTAAAIVALFIAIGATLIVVGGKSSGDAREASAQFAAAVINKNPRLAPNGAEDYVAGIEQRFGGVSGARVISTRNTHHGSGSNRTSNYVSDVLLHTAKGPAVVELEFGGGFIVWGKKTVTGIEELAPVDVPDSSLSDDEFVALAKAFVARGGERTTASDLTWTRADGLEAADDEVLDTDPVPAATPTKKEKAQKRAADQQLRDGLEKLDCVKKADGDIDKLTRCATI